MSTTDKQTYNFVDLKHRLNTKLKSKYLKMIMKQCGFLDLQGRFEAKYESVLGFSHYAISYQKESFNIKLYEEGLVTISAAIQNWLNGPNIFNSNPFNLKEGDIFYQDYSYGFGNKDYIMLECKYKDLEIRINTFKYCENTGEIHYRLEVKNTHGNYLQKSKNFSMNRKKYEITDADIFELVKNNKERICSVRGCVKP